MNIHHQASLQIACDNPPHAHWPSEAQFTTWVNLALTSHAKTDMLVAIRLVDRAEMQQLNAHYRGKNKPTNILSFPFEGCLDETPQLLGDLIICPEVLALEAEQQHKSLPHHYAHLCIHGCLHLLGFDHEDASEAAIMEQLEIDLLQQLHIPNPYQWTHPHE